MYMKPVHYPSDTVRLLAASLIDTLVLVQADSAAEPRFRLTSAPLHLALSLDRLRNGSGRLRD